MKEIAAALVKAQMAFGPALKTSTNPHFRSRYADLSACVEAVIDGLNNNGIALVQKNHPHPDGVVVETLFVHESGEVLDCGQLFVPASKADPQGFGSALTYARRYSLMSACGIAPEDDDGNAASKARQGSNPLDSVKAPAKTGQTFLMQIPGKEPISYSDSKSYMDGMIEVREKVEKSKLETRTKMTKLRELKEANESVVDKIEVTDKARLLADYQARLKRLGAQLPESTETA